MTSRFDESLFSAYLDDEATVEERAAVEKQLHDSAEARDVLQELQQLSQDLQSLPKKELPDHFPRQVLAAAEREMLLPGGDSPDTVTSAGRSKTNWVRTLVPLVTTGAALLLALSILDWSSQRQPTEDSNTEHHKQAHHPVPGGERVAENEKEAQKQPGEDSFGKLALKSTGDAPGMRKKDNDKSVEALRPAFKEPLVPPIALSPQQKPQGNGRLAFVEDLRKLRQSDIGRVLTALEPTPDGVAVVKLTVVDCRAGANALQLLLSRNDIHLQPSNETPPSTKASAAAAKGKPSRDQQFVAVYVESTSERLARAVAELKSDRHFRRLEVSRPLALAQLDRSTRSRLDSLRIDEQKSFDGKKRRFRGRSTPPGRAAKVGKKPTGKSKSQGKSAGQAAGAGKQKEAKEDSFRKQHNDLLRVAELARISRQLRLTIPADVLKRQADEQQPQPTGPVVVQNRANGPIGRAGGKKAPQNAPAARPLQVLFILVCDEK